MTEERLKYIVQVAAKAGLAEQDEVDELIALARLGLLVKYAEAKLYDIRHGHHGWYVLMPDGHSAEPKPTIATAIQAALTWEAEHDRR